MLNHYLHDLKLSAFVFFKPQVLTQSNLALTFLRCSLSTKQRMKVFCSFRHKYFFFFSRSYPATVNQDRATFLSLQKDCFWAVMMHYKIFIKYVL